MNPNPNKRLQPNEHSQHSKGSESNKRLLPRGHPPFEERSASKARSALKDEKVSREQSSNRKRPPSEERRQTSTEDLASRMQNLPQELYDRICREVFTATSGRVEVSKCYKTPRLLRVDHDSREHFARSYYSNTQFHYEYMIHSQDLVYWLSSLPREHLAMLRDLRVSACWRRHNGHFDELGVFPCPKHGRRITEPMFVHLGQQLKRMHLNIDQGVLRLCDINANCGTDEKTIIWFDGVSETIEGKRSERHCTDSLC